MSGALRRGGIGMCASVGAVEGSVNGWSKTGCSCRTFVRRFSGREREKTRGCLVVPTIGEEEEEGNCGVLSVRQELFLEEERERYNGVFSPRPELFDGAL